MKNPSQTCVGEHISHQNSESCSDSLCFQSSEKIRRFSMDDFKEMGLLSEKGKIRLLPAQRYFNENENYFPVLPQLFEAWRDEEEYLVFRERSQDPPLYLALKCSKRGNDIYRQRIKRRFAFLMKSMDEEVFFHPNDFAVDRKVKTKVLWLTLTWNTRLFSIRNSWKTEVSEGWNRFISAMRRRYGKISVLRSFEASRRGFPHIHAILVFHEKEFSVFPHLDSKEKLTYRISEKSEFEDLWHSFIDVETFSSAKKFCFYALKYQLKVNESREGSSEGRAGSEGKSSRTLSFLWLFRKRSYAVSGSFRLIFSRLDERLHISNMELGGSWELLGVFSGKVLGLSGEWVARVDPERLIGLLPDGNPDVDEGVVHYGF